MERQKEYMIYIGLLKSDMKTNLNSLQVLNRATEEFNKIGVIGFNFEFIKGSWKGQKEDTLYLNFINTFEVYEKDIFKVLKTLKVEFEQESILIKSKEVEFNFI